MLPLTGEIMVAPPGAVPAASQAACIQSTTPTATWLMVLQAAGQTLNVPMYLITTAGAETAYGPVKIVVCLPPPDVPVALGGATFGAKLFQATFTVNGIFSAVSSGTWLSIWSPYTPLVGKVNAAGSVASPSGIAPGSLSVKVAKVGLVKSKLTGKVSQGGTAVGGANVQVWAGLDEGRLEEGRHREVEGERQLCVHLRQGGEVLPHPDDRGREPGSGALHEAAAGTSRAVHQRNDQRVHGAEPDRQAVARIVRTRERRGAPTRRPSPLAA